MKIKTAIITLLTYISIGLPAFAQDLAREISLETRSSTLSALDNNKTTRSLSPNERAWAKKLKARSLGSTNFMVSGQLKLTKNFGCSPDQLKVINTKFNVNVDSQRTVRINFPSGLTANGKVALNGKSFKARSNMTVYNSSTGHNEARQIDINAGAISSKGYAPFQFTFGARDLVNNLTCSVKYNGTLKVRKS